MARIGLEVAVDSPAGLAAAVAGGADRVELCAALELGGLTPAPGLVAQARDCGLPVFAMIRPRAGDFVFDAAEVEAALADIAAMRAAGLAGVVIGAARPDGALDEGVLARMVAAAGPLAVTLHRVFDLVPEQSAALEVAVRLGIGRVLTSGGATRAVDGAAQIAALVAQARGRIGILPGAGITPDNVAALVAATGVVEVHASCAVSLPQDPDAVALGFCGPVRRQTDAETVRKMRAALAA
ncbi:MAG: copper homeostasis protein CutC [Limimaricola sp.]|uniref:copper homeostasis protein CutC n=1 Tax=Limimaricola sp. TaxID=2211665 RepID=UPI001E0DAD8D|nr:copper homeostasis protein CutC [Limimaricola sp.]MBI1416930.1 copper homeostasis protein CutC [Limimaricola sp.]